MRKLQNLSTFSRKQWRQQTELVPVIIDKEKLVNFVCNYEFSVQQRQQNVQKISQKCRRHGGK